MEKKELKKLADHLKFLANQLDASDANLTKVDWVQGNLQGIAELLEIRSGNKDDEK